MTSPPGDEHAAFFRRAELAALVDVHRVSSKENEDPLTEDETNIIKGLITSMVRTRRFAPAFENQLADLKAEQHRASMSSVRLSPSSEIDSGFHEWPGCKKVHATLTNNMWHVRTLDGDALISLHDMVWYLRSPGTLT